MPPTNADLDLVSKGYTIDENSITVVFFMWGKRCTAIFDDSSEMHWREWVLVCMKKEYIYPIVAYDGRGGILATRDDFDLMEI